MTNNDTAAGASTVGRGLGTKAAVAFGVVVMLVGLGWYLTRPSPEVRQLAERNPDWDVAMAARGHLHLTEKSSRMMVVISPVDAGPDTIEQLPCSDMVRIYPAWFRLPDDARTAGPLACVHLSGPDRDEYVINFRTALGVPEVWDNFYEPLVTAAGLDSNGGGTTYTARVYRSKGASGPPASIPASMPRDNAVRWRRNLVSYHIDAPAGSSERETRLLAFYEGDLAIVVATFRPQAP